MTMTISGTAGFTFPDNSTLDSSSQVVKAWVNFNGTGTPTIRAAYNVGSITDNAVGGYTINMITPMVDVDYTVTATSSVGGAIGSQALAYVYGTPTTSSFSMGTTNASGTLQDNAYDFAAVFR